MNHEQNPQPVGKAFHSIREMMNLTVADFADTTAYEYKDDEDILHTVTFGEFHDDTENLGAALTALGYGNAHIACIGKNSYRWILVYLTVLQSAGVFVPIDKELPGNEKKYLVENSDATVVFFGEEYEEWVTENHTKMPNVKCFIGLDLKEEHDGLLSLNQLLNIGKSLDKSRYDALASDENDLKLLVYTSGTTGIAKGVMLTEHNIVSCIYYGVQVSQIYDKGLSVLPYNHCYESVCDILVAIYCHATLCINRTLKDIVRDMKYYQPSYIYLVPALAEVLYASVKRNIKKEHKENDFRKAVIASKLFLRIGIDMRPVLFRQIREVFGGRLIKIVCGGAPIRPEIGEFFGQIGIYLTGGYGITECSPLISGNNEKSKDFNYLTAGHKLACIDWRISEPNEDGIGEICIKGDTVMKGYYNDPKQTAEVLRDGWFYTGDYGYISKDNQIVVTGRKKNLIVLNNGKNIYPEEIEGRILSLDSVNEAIVRGLKNDRGDEYALVAEIFPEKETDERRIMKEIREALKELPEYKQIKKVVLRPVPFDKTTTNKIRR